MCIATRLLFPSHNGHLCFWWAVLFTVCDSLSAAAPEGPRTLITSEADVPEQSGAVRGKAAASLTNTRPAVEGSTVNQSHGHPRVWGCIGVCVVLKHLWHQGHIKNSRQTAYGIWPGLNWHLLWIKLMRKQKPPTCISALECILLSPCPAAWLHRGKAGSQSCSCFFSHDLCKNTLVSEDKTTKL